MSNILVVAAHPDDEWLGMGGTLLKLKDEGAKIEILYYTVGRDDKQLRAIDKVRDVLGCNIIPLNYPDQKLDTFGISEIAQDIEERVGAFKPEIVFSHASNDLNRDHRVVSEAVKIACRPLPGSPIKAIYGFEVVSSTEWGTGFRPTMFKEVDVVEKTVALNSIYDSEMRKAPHARCYEAVQALAELRGYSVGLPAAEAFEIVRQIQ